MKFIRHNHTLINLSSIYSLSLNIGLKTIFIWSVTGQCESLVHTEEQGAIMAFNSILQMTEAVDVSTF